MKFKAGFLSQLFFVGFALMIGQCAFFNTDPRSNPDSNTTLKAQILNPVKWKFSSNKISATEVQLVFEAHIEKGWHMYSQFLPDGGPLPTLFTIEKSKSFQAEGKVVEGKPEKMHDDAFGLDVFYFEGVVSFKQKVKISSLKPFEIKAKVEYQACKESCITGEEEFVFKLEGAGGPKDSI